MMVSARRKQSIALALTVIVVLSVVGAYLYFGQNEDDASVSILVIDTWSIESGSYYPWMWINSTDDRFQGYTYAVLEVIFSDVVTGEYVGSSGFHGVASSYSNGTWSVQERLSLQGWRPGEYAVDVYLNCTFDGYEAPATYANAHVGGDMSLPLEHPSIPRVLGIMFFPTEEEGNWHYSVTIEDPDQDGDRAQVYASNETGYSIYNCWANNTDDLLTWVIEGDVNLACERFFFNVWVTDKDGPYATATFHNL